MFLKVYFRIFANIEAFHKVFVIVEINVLKKAVFLKLITISRENLFISETVGLEKKILKTS